MLYPVPTAKTLILQKLQVNIYYLSFLFMTQNLRLNKIIFSSSNVVTYLRNIC